MNHKVSSTFGISSVMAIAMIVVFASPLSASGIVSMSYPPLQQQGVASLPDQYGDGMNEPGEYAAGTIASFQNDKNGKPEWMVSGLWKGSLTNLTSAMSSSSSNTTTNMNLPTATFNAIFDMVMLNGTAMHKHHISDFKLTNITMPNEKTVVYNGTATITMKEGPINSVPVSVRIMNDNVISIMPDPASTKDHFGNTPIYGTITEDVRIKK